MQGDPHSRTWGSELRGTWYLIGVLVIRGSYYLGIKLGGPAISVNPQMHETAGKNSTALLASVDQGVVLKRVRVVHSFRWLRSVLS